MKIVELTGSTIPLDELLEMARQEIIILQKANNERFVLTLVDEFALEVELLRNNDEFMAYLDELSEQEATIPLEDVEENLGLKL
jgi:hypothetical protein